jgi:pimeloyl-ACP methyl ester carboxylesterase
MQSKVSLSNLDGQPDLSSLRQGTSPGHVNFVRTGSGTPAILVHGLAASLHDWDDLIPDLAGSGFEVCALDLLGHGDSYIPARLADYNVQHVHDHFRDWLDSLFPDEPVLLVGHSLGGYLALMHALRNPQRVKALVLVNPFYSLDQVSTFLRLVFRRPLSTTTFIRLTPYWLFRKVIDLTSLELGLRHPQHYLLTEQVRKQTALDYKRAAPGIFNIPCTLVELKDQFSGLNIPILVVWGENDHTLDPASFAKLAQLLPNASLAPIASAGHVPHQSDFKTFNKLVLDFIAKYR